MRAVHEARAHRSQLEDEKAAPVEPYALWPLPPNPYVNRSGDPLFLLFGSAPAGRAGAADREAGKERTSRLEDSLQILIKIFLFFKKK